jgi:8-oxo-dGTP diphosphatase
MPYTYKYPRPALTVDIVVLGDYDTKPQILLVKRGQPPFLDHWALPGGFVELDETLDDAARRELEEETGLKNIEVEQFYTFGKIDRDPRERVVSVAYFALVNCRDCSIQAGSDAARAEWFSIGQLPPLAFDHQTILETAMRRVPFFLAIGK